jgi:hypothetical protein
MAVAVGACLLWSTDLLGGPENRGNQIGGYVDFVDALRVEGAQLKPWGSVEQPFFDVRGEVILVNGSRVEVFSFEEEALQEESAREISTDGFTIGTTFVDWIDQPNFWAKDRIIVLYVGTDAATISLLNRVLGDPITDGVSLPLGDPPYAVAAAEKELGGTLWRNRWFRPTQAG